VNQKQDPEVRGKYEIIIKEKKGFFGSAIPLRLPTCVAIICCFLNCICPGLGEPALVSSLVVIFRLFSVIVSPCAG